MKEVVARPTYLIKTFHAFVQPGSPSTWTPKLNTLRNIKQSDQTPSVCDIRIAR